MTSVYCSLLPDSRLLIIVYIKSTIYIYQIKPLDCTDRSLAEFVIALAISHWAVNAEASQRHFISIIL
jgi:hypothetical protein